MFQNLNNFPPPPPLSVLSTSRPSTSFPYGVGGGGGHTNTASTVVTNHTLSSSLNQRNFERHVTVLITTLVLTVLSIISLSTSLATNHWIESDAYRVSDESASRKLGSHLNFGLFRGGVYLDAGFGMRNYDMDVREIQFREQSFFVRELYVMTIAGVVTGIFFGLVQVVLVLVNLHKVSRKGVTYIDTIDAVCNFPGLITLNLLDLICSLCAICSWIFQLYFRLQENVVPRRHVLNGGWSSLNAGTTFGFSFYLTFLSGLLLFINSIVIILHVHRKRRRLRALIKFKRAQKARSGSTSADTVLMYGPESLGGKVSHFTPVNNNRSTSRNPDSPVSNNNNNNDLKQQYANNTTAAPSMLWTSPSPYQNQPQNLLLY